MNFLYYTDSSYTEAEILQAEKYIFKMLEWNMNYPNSIHFLRRVSKADEYNVQARTVAKYFLEIECVEWASMWLARFVLGKEDWVCHSTICYLRGRNESLSSQMPNLAILPTQRVQ
jgi:G2/mitotic-specific cyclin 1/2